MFTNSRARFSQCVLGVLLCAFAGSGFAKDRAECERAYKPTFGQPGKDVAWEPTTSALAADMLRLAKTTAADRVYDLGAGDGSIVIVAAKQFGATAIGIEYNAALATLGQCFVEAEGVADKAKIVQGDIFKTDFSSATVVTLYLLPELNLRLRPTLLNMPPGTRVVSHSHKMGDWNWDDEVERDDHFGRLWIVPAKVQGTWEFTQKNGTASFRLALQQKFQVLKGDLQLNGQKSKVAGMMRGAEVTIDLGGQRKLLGKIDQKQMTATVTDASGAKEFVGTLR